MYQDIYQLYYENEIAQEGLSFKQNWNDFKKWAANLIDDLIIKVRQTFSTKNPIYVPDKYDISYYFYSDNSSLNYLINTAADNPEPEDEYTDDLPTMIKKIDKMIIGCDDFYNKTIRENTRKGFVSCKPESGCIIKSEELFDILRKLKKALNEYRFSGSKTDKKVIQLYKKYIELINVIIKGASKLNKITEYYFDDDDDDDFDNI